MREPHAEDRASQHPQPRRLQFEADQKQQQHHAELGEVQDVFDTGNDSEAPRTDDRARNQIAQHRSKTELIEQGDRDYRRAKKYRRFFNEAHGRKASSLYK